MMERGSGRVPMTLKGVTNELTALEIWALDPDPTSALELLELR